MLLFNRVGRLFGLIVVSTLAGCASSWGPVNQGLQPAVLAQATAVGTVLDTVPPPDQQVTVAVYDFPDKTGQFATNDNFADNSRAVTQGATSILVDVLRSVGGGTWFEVVEREGLKSLMTERDLIQKTRIAFQGTNAEGLPALRFAGVIIEGGIVAYDTNVATGGAGARYLGIGANTEHRTDVVTVALRAVSVSNGRVLTSVTTTKTIYSVLVRGGAFLYVAVDGILEAEAGYSRNEPREVAVREAMELAVLSMLVQGIREDQFAFADATVGNAFLDQFAAVYESPEGFAAPPDTAGAKSADTRGPVIPEPLQSLS